MTGKSLGAHGALREALPDVAVVFDKFHLARLAQRALDEVRRALVRKLPPDERRPLKCTRWALLKSPETLNPAQQGKLVTIQRSNEPLYRAYLLKESFLNILAGPDPEEARAEEESQKRNPTGMLRTNAHKWSVI